MKKDNELKNWVLEKIQEKNMSLRQLAGELGFSHSHLIDVLNGKRKLSVELGNSLADYFNIQRLVVYNLVGWINLNEDDIYFERFRELSERDPEFKKLINEVLNIEDEKERKRVMRMLRAGMED